ncbi:MAG: hypothetical protein WDM77_15455 [Steroidobacteraceae bacterium]
MSLRLDAWPIIGIAVLMLLTGFSKPADASAPTASRKVSTTDVVVTKASFRCIRDMTAVRGFYVDNLLGNVAATVAVAESPTGGTYPPGSLVQVNPSLAMIKHLRGRNPETNDWEFVELDLNRSWCDHPRPRLRRPEHAVWPQLLQLPQGGQGDLGHGLRADPRMQFDPAHARHAPRPSEY